MFANKRDRFKVLRIPALTVMLLLVIWLQSEAWAACDDTINDPGKDTWITYHTNKYDSSKLILICVSSSGERKECLPELLGNTCGAPRVDGCSVPNPVAWTFTTRDKYIMKAACNEHDLCYSTKGIEKKHCDDALQKNLEHLKDRFNGGFTVSDIVKAVLMSGDSGYKSGQEWGEKNNCRANKIRTCSVPPTQTEGPAKENGS